MSKSNANADLAKNVLALLGQKKAVLLARYTNGTAAVVTNDPDPLDCAQATQELANRVALDTHDRFQLEATNAAIERWTNSPATAHLCFSGGECLGDGQIGGERLLVVPTAQFCTPCQQRLADLMWKGR